MCTSLTYENSRGDHFLARTMDFAFELGGQPIFMPRNRRLMGMLVRLRRSMDSLVPVLI